MKVIITAYKEKETIYKCIQSFLPEVAKQDIIVVAPDEKTLFEAEKLGVKVIKDPGKGKPTALNLVFSKIKDKILILTDGDVYIAENSVEELLTHFKDEKIGAVSARPVSLNSRKTMLGFWSHLLTDKAHEERMKRKLDNKFLFCSGYLYAIRNIVGKIHENSLADDAEISHIINEKGYKITYEPNARVFVKYPTTVSDWVKQKRRSIAGYHQISRWFPKAARMRTFGKEAANIFNAFSYVRRPMEITHTWNLIIIRLYMWILTWWDQKITKKGFEDTWKRVESTK